MTTKKFQPFVAERIEPATQPERDADTNRYHAFSLEIAAMDDDALAAKVVALRQELAKHDARYAAAREQWCRTGVYVPWTDEQLEESLRVRRELGTVEHHIARRVAKASLADYGSSPIDWPLEDEENS